MASVRCCAALDVPIYTILCCTSSCEFVLHLELHEPVLHLQMTVYKGFCAASGRNKPKNKPKTTETD
jgi:hypothetical protein